MQQLLTLEFWISALESFRNTGFLAPVLLAALESVLPPWVRSLVSSSEVKSLQ